MHEMLYIITVCTTTCFVAVLAYCSMLLQKIKFVALLLQMNNALWYTGEALHEIISRKQRKVYSDTA